MFGGGYDATWLFSVRSLAALLCVAFAVKMMDDFMDLRHDVELGVPSIAARLGEATLPYAMLLLALAALFDGKASLPLFAASYAVGMAFDLSRPLPSGLYGWQEAALALVAGAILAGPWSNCGPFASSPSCSAWTTSPTGNMIGWQGPTTWCGGSVWER